MSQIISRCRFQHTKSSHKHLPPFFFLSGFFHPSALTLVSTAPRAEHLIFLQLFELFLPWNHTLQLAHSSARRLKSRHRLIETKKMIGKQPILSRRLHWRHSRHYCPTARYQCFSLSPTWNLSHSNKQLFLLYALFSFFLFVLFMCLFL